MFCRKKWYWTFWNEYNIYKYIYRRQCQLLHNKNLGILCAKFATIIASIVQSNVIFGVYLYSIFKAVFGFYWIRIIFFIRSSTNKCNQNSTDDGPNNMRSDLYFIWRRNTIFPCGELTKQNLTKNFRNSTEASTTTTTEKKIRAPIIQAFESIRIY